MELDLDPISFAKDSIFRFQAIFLHSSKYRCKFIDSIISERYTRNMIAILNRTKIYTYNIYIYMSFKLWLRLLLKFRSRMAKSTNTMQLYEWNQVMTILYVWQHLQHYDFYWNKCRSFQILKTRKCRRKCYRMTQASIHSNCMHGVPLSGGTDKLL